MKRELWKTVNGYESYEISNMGNVRNVRTGKQLSKFPISNGYLKVGLYTNGVAKPKFIHRLVAMAFCDGYSDGYVVDHIDGNITNNQASNLRWVSQKENVYDSYKRGKQRRPAKQVIQLLNGSIISAYESVCEAFRATGIRHISEAATGKRRSAGGYQWRYKEGRD